MNRTNMVTVLIFIVSFLCRFAASTHTKHNRTAFVNETVVLPCWIASPRDGISTVEWSKQGISPNITFLFRHGKETKEEKHEAFQNRTWLIGSDVSHGNFSLAISNLRLSDGGRHECITLEGRRRKLMAEVFLTVASLSEPRLTVTDEGGLVAECRAECWYPQPYIEFSDDQESPLKAETTMTHQEHSQCVTLISRVALSTAISSVTCTVTQHQTHQSRQTHFNIPDHWKPSSCLFNNLVCALITSVLLCGVFVLILWKTGCFASTSKAPVPNNSTSHENEQRLQAEIEGLRSADADKEKKISALRAEIKGLQSKSRRDSQSDQSHSGSSINVKQQAEALHPAPAATSSGDRPKDEKKSKSLKPPSNLKKPKSLSGLPSDDKAQFSPPSPKDTVLRSLSFSGYRQSGIKSVKDQRRNTIPNRFSVLADVSEDLEQLLKS